MSHLLGRNAAASLTGNYPKQTATSFPVALLFSASQRVLTLTTVMLQLDAELLELLFSRH